MMMMMMMLLEVLDNQCWDTWWLRPLRRQLPSRDWWYDELLTWHLGKLQLIIILAARWLASVEPNSIGLYVCHSTGKGATSIVDCSLMFLEVRDCCTSTCKCVQMWWLSKCLLQRCYKHLHEENTGNTKLRWSVVGPRCWVLLTSLPRSYKSGNPESRPKSLVYRGYKPSCIYKATCRVYNSIYK